MPRLATRARAARRSVVALGAVVAALLLSAPGASAATNCPDADAAPAAVGVDRAVAALGCLVDHERQAVGLATVALDARARQAAQWHADDMATRNFFSHVSPLGAPHGTDVGERLTNAGYTWTLAGENIARGQTTPRTVMTAWLASQGHCENIMRTGFTDAGFGVSTAGNGPYWVQVFARPMGVAEPAGPAVGCPRTPATPAPTGDPAPAATPPVTTPPATVPATSTTPGSGTSTGTGTAAGAGSAAKAAKATAARKRRRLTIRVTVPATGVTRTTIVVRVRQGARTVRTTTVTRAPGRTYRLKLTLPAARAGRVRVRVGTRTVTAAFR